jgi:hypothetical protein
MRQPKGESLGKRGRDLESSKPALAGGGAGGGAAHPRPLHGSCGVVVNLAQQGGQAVYVEAAIAALGARGCSSGAQRGRNLCRGSKVAAAAAAAAATKAAAEVGTCWAPSWQSGAHLCSPVMYSRSVSIAPAHKLQDI